MRLHLRSTIGVAVILIIFIVFAYQAGQQSEEIKVRSEPELFPIPDERKKEKLTENAVNVDSRNLSEMASDVTAALRPRVNILHGAQDTRKQSAISSDRIENNAGRNDSLISQSLKPTRNPLPVNFTVILAEIIKQFPIFQPTEEVEFPTKEGASPRIPHIIHQIYTNITVVANYSKYITTFIKNNPKWEYRFWTYESGRRLIAKLHPYLLPTFDNLTSESVKKTDLIKYAVLYEFGGIYADLDVKNYRPLDLVTMKFACIIPTEPFEHASFFLRRTMLLNSGILLCRPKHPFFKALLTNIPEVDPKSSPIKGTGSRFVTAQYLKYMNLTENDINMTKTDNDTNTPYFYKGTLDAEDENGIYIPNSQYFNDKIDPQLVNKEGNSILCQTFRNIKYVTRLLLMSPIRMRACAEYESRRQIRKNKRYTFTEHYWHHLWVVSLKWLKSLETRHIKDIVPNVILY